MSSKQLTIPGLPAPAVVIRKRQPRRLRDRIANLEQRVTQLEAEIILLRAQLEGDKDHA